MANAKFDLKSPTLKPVLAYVGVTDLAVEKVRDYVTAVQKTDAKKVRAAIETRVAELQGEALAYPAKVQSLVDENVTAATATYTDLIKRGESLVGRIRRQKSTQDTVAAAKTTVAKAKTTTTQAKKAADASVDAADRAAANKVAPKTTAKKASAKKASATRAKNAASKKAATTRSTAKATVTAAEKTAATAAKAVTEGAAKIGD